MPLELQEKRNCLIYFKHTSATPNRMLINIRFLQFEDTPTCVHPHFTTLHCLSPTPPMPTHRMPRHCHFVSELSSTKAAGFGEEGIPLTPHMSYRLVRRKGKPRGKWLGNWCCLEGDLNVRVIVDLHDFIFHGGMWFLAIPLARVGAPSYCVVLASAVAHYLPRRRPGRARAAHNILHHNFLLFAQILTGFLSCHPKFCQPYFL